MNKHSVSCPKYLVATFIVTALSGCMAAEQKNQWSFVCADDYQFAATYARDGNSVRVETADDEFQLDQVRSASGSRYSDGDTEFWTKGVMARLQLLDENAEPVVYENCQGDNS
jgi:membrane-bound inhibitor of C-type lysozyme